MRLFQSTCVLVGTVLPLFTAFPISSPREIEIIPDKYIITFKKGIDQAAIEAHTAWVSSVQARNTARGFTTAETPGLERMFSIHNFNAYSGSFDRETIEEIRSHPNVESVEPDSMAYVTELIEQRNATYGPRRISHREIPTGDNSYWYDSKAGEGSFVYIMDTGINKAHVDFEGRAIPGVNLHDVAFDDTHGHGSHCAGIAGSKTYGVAKKATIVDVKVFTRGGGAWSLLMGGLDWSVKNITGEDRQAKSAVSISISGPTNQAMNNAVKAAVEAGVTVVVASGNDGRDAGRNSPGSAPESITVGSINSRRGMDTRSSFSNYGSSVAIHAPGEGIISTYKGSRDATANMSGTSMAAPHIAGLIAYLQSIHDLPDPAAARRKLLELATSDKIQDVRGSANKLAYNGSGK
uniref:Oryzin n=1 Tax=Coccidioides posadasii RMSCC 3488 TaxID=454284 RepID=A0A0J6I5I3_COCPO|nr:oryzin [Coccidioides posadasii RMSCC 3488]